MDVSLLVMIIRIVVSGICGIVIGFERKNRAKEAGVRTHCIVACAACLMMIISKYGFYDLVATAVQNGVEVKLDPSRLAQGIVTGVGFLGAGMIYIQRGSIRGLTTASGIWATSGIGMAIGAGMYNVGIATTIIILAVQTILHKKIKFMTEHKIRYLAVYGVSEDGYQSKVSELMHKNGINISEVSIKQNEDSTLDYTFYLDMPSAIEEESIIKEISYRCNIDFIH